MALAIYAFAVSFIFTSALVIRYYLAGCRPRGFVPGPPTLPFFGNITQIPRLKAFLKFKDLGKRYGSIIGLKMGSQNVVVLNSYEHVRALFDKRGSIYSSRPQSHIPTNLICPNNLHLLLLPYSPPWRHQRKILQTLLSITAIDALLPLQNAEATQTLHDLLTDPANYYDHIRRYTTAVILASVYGERGASFDAPNVQRLYHAQEQFTEILEQGATPPVDAFPVLKWVPEWWGTWAAGWKRWARGIRREQRGLYLGLLEGARARFETEGGGPRCFLREMMREEVRGGLDDEHVAYLAGNLMEAGSDTTASTLLSFLLAMTKYPQELRKAQEEVDRVCGATRSPQPDDLESLPFVKACMDETLRWRPVAAGGIPHMLTQDDTYLGYSLPKGTVFLANTWAIHHDEEEYDKPSLFKPDRFLDNKFGTRKLVDERVDGNRRVSYGFGAGRRICPGQHLARNSLTLNMAKIAWAFDLRAEGVVDDDVATAYTDGFLITPKEFPVRITPRSDARAKVIVKEFEEMKPFWEPYET